MYNESKFVKIKINKLYIMPSSDIVRVVRVASSHSKIIVHNYHSHTNEVIDYETAPKILAPVMRIGEVGRILGKSPATLRKYEQMGLIPEVRKISLASGAKMKSRVYTVEDVEELANFFDRRKPVGRPAATNLSGINRKAIKQRLDSKYTKG